MVNQMPTGLMNMLPVAKEVCLLNDNLGSTVVEMQHYEYKKGPSISIASNQRPLLASAMLHFHHIL